MALFTISLNQLVEASSGTLKAKQRIVQQQISVSKIIKNQDADQALHLCNPHFTILELIRFLAG